MDDNGWLEYAYNGQVYRVPSIIYTIDGEVWMLKAYEASEGILVYSRYGVEMRHSILSYPKIS